MQLGNIIRIGGAASVVMLAMAASGSALAVPMTQTVMSVRPTVQYGVAFGGLTTIRDPTTVACRFPAGTNPCSTTAGTSLSVSQFDPSLGNLLQIDISYSVSTQFAAQVKQNTFVTSAPPGVNSLVRVNGTSNQLTGNGVNLFVPTAFQQFNQSVPGLTFFAPPFNFNSPGTSGLIATVLTAASSFFTDYIGTGLLLFNATQNGNVLPTSSFAGTGFSGASFSPLPTGMVPWGFQRAFAPQVTVTYTYEEQVVAAIPEPSSIIPFAFGLVGLMAMLRRRRVI